MILMKHMIYIGHVPEILSLACRSSLASDHTIVDSARRPNQVCDGMRIKSMQLARERRHSKPDGVDLKSH